MVVPPLRLVFCYEVIRSRCEFLQRDITEYSIQGISVSIDARIYYTETSNIILNKKYSKSINHGPILSH